jgi:hypothetical protein
MAVQWPAFGAWHGVLTFTDALTPSLDAGTAVPKTILSEALRYRRENCMARSAFSYLEGF